MHYSVIYLHVQSKVMFLTKLKQNSFPSSQPHSVLPSLRPGSEIVCHLGSTCRVPLYISPGAAGYVAHHTFPYCHTRERKKEGERGRHADRLTVSDRRTDGSESDRQRGKERECVLIYIKILSTHWLTLIRMYPRTHPPPTPPLPPLMHILIDASTQVYTYIYIHTKRAHVTRNDAYTYTH